MANTTAEYIESRQSEYPYEVVAPYTGFPKKVFGHFIWIPNPDGKTVRFLFKTEFDRDALLAQGLHVEASS